MSANGWCFSVNTREVNQPPQTLTLRAAHDQVFRLTPFGMDSRTKRSPPGLPPLASTQLPYGSQPPCLGFPHAVWLAHIFQEVSGVCEWFLLLLPSIFLLLLLPSTCICCFSRLLTRSASGDQPSMAALLTQTVSARAGTRSRSTNCALPHGLWKVRGRSELWLAHRARGEPPTCV